MPSPAIAPMMTKAEMEVKNAPACGLLNSLVTSTVTPVVATADTAEEARFSVVPRRTSATPRPPGPAPWRAGGG